MPKVKVRPTNLMRTGVDSLEANMLAFIADELDPHGNSSGEYDAFKKKYFHNLRGFAEDCIIWHDEKLTEYQAEGMEQLVKHRRYSIRGPHGLGKTAFASITILWFALTRDGEDWKIPTLASTWRQLTKFLWPEVHKWSKRIRWDKVGRNKFAQKELLQLNLRLSTGEAFAIAAENPEHIEGAHAENILYIFDEAKTIPPPTWDAAEGALSVGEAYMLAISTPGEPQGRFYEIHKRAPGYEDWAVRHVTSQEVVKAGRMQPRWVAARKKQWGEKSAVYQNRVEGQFAASDEDGIISLVDVERAIDRWREIKDGEEANPDIWGRLDRLGVDIGRGGDPSVIARRHGNSLKEFDEMNERDVMSVTGRVAGILQKNKDADAALDVIGIGAGVFDRLREIKGIAGRVIGFNAADRTDARDKSGELGFVNDRAWAWWTIRELLQDDLINLPPDDMMIGDLTAPKWKVMSGGRVQIEEKSEIKKRIGRSTDYGDAVVMAFWKRSGGLKDDELGRLERNEVAWDKLPAELVQLAKDSGIDVETLMKMR